MKVKCRAVLYAAAFLVLGGQVVVCLRQVVINHVAHVARTWIV